MGSFSPSFCWRDGGTVYCYGATLLSSDNGTATYLYVLNGHGDVAQMLAGTTVVKSYNYDAFGNEIGINTADTNPFRYCAQYFDKESGTIYLRARYYAPGLGRFTQQDAWEYADSDEPQSLNLYVYCINDPVDFIDPNGRSGILLALLLGMASLALTSCGRTQYSGDVTEVFGEILLVSEPQESIEAAAILAAQKLANDTEIINNIYNYEYQVNIVYHEDDELLDEDERKYYVTFAYTDHIYEYVKYNPSKNPLGYKTVGLLHTHGESKDDPASVFTADYHGSIGVDVMNQFVLEPDGSVIRRTKDGKNKEITVVTFGGLQ